MVKIIIPLVIGIAIRFLLAFGFYGGADATNGASFFDFIISGYDVYSARSPWPYLPFTNAYAWLWGYLAEFLNVNVNLAYRLTSVVYDVGIGVVVYQYVKKFLPKKAIQSLWLYMINPVTIFIVSLLGFTDSSTIFFLLLACYFNDFFKGKTVNVFSAISLALSISIKPITFIFIPFFIFGSSRKWLYAIVLTVSVLILNSYYISGASGSDLLWLTIYIRGKTLFGHQIGAFGVAPILYDLGSSIGKLSFLSSLAGMGSIVMLYLLYLRKIKAIEFCFLIFLVTLLFNNHVHPQYFLWIVPFAIITNSRSWPFVIFISLLLVSHITEWYTNMSAYSPHVILGSFMPSSPDNLVRILFNIMNNIWVKNIIYLLAVMILIPVQVVRKLYSEAANLILRIRQTFNGQNLLIASIFAFVFGILFYLVTYRFYFVVNSYSPDQITIVDIIIRNFILVIFSTTIGFYIILTYSLKSFLFIAINTTTNFLILFLVYLGIRPHPLGAAYFLIISLCIFIIFDGARWLFIHGKKNALLKTKLSFKSSSAFIVGTVPMIVILVLSWPALYKGVDNKFNVQFENVSRDYKNFPRGRYSDMISIQPPRNGFNYGQNYIFKTSFSIHESVNYGELFLVSEDHHKVTINDRKLPTQYGALYYTRHGSKRRIYDFGIHTINIKPFLKIGENELRVWNNLSSNVYPTGIGVKLELETNDGRQIIYRSEDMEWDVYTGKLDGHNLIEKEKIDYELKSKDMISIDKHFIYTDHVERYLHSMDYLFIEPKLSGKRFIYSSIELWIFILFTFLGLAYFLLSFGIKNEKLYKKFHELSR